MQSSAQEVTMLCKLIAAAKDSWDGFERNSFCDKNCILFLYHCLYSVDAPQRLNSFSEDGDFMSSPFLDRWVNCL